MTPNDVTGQQRLGQVMAVHSYIHVDFELVVADFSSIRPIN